MNTVHTAILPAELAKRVTAKYHNERLACVNDHEIRMSVMTHDFPWHRHPSSDETFIGVAGKLVIEFEDGQVVLGPGEIITVPAGIIHRTRPAGERSVNLTFERATAESELVDAPVTG